MDNLRNFKAISSIDMPRGWVRISDEFLTAFRDELTPDEAIAYFDGRSPTWREALSDRIPQREIVRDLHNLIDEARRVKRRQVTLLLGAGGEGKSTVLRQVVSNISKLNSFQHILWHEDINTPLERSFVNDLTLSRDTWLIASDEADRICKDVFESVCLLHEKAKNNIQFLLCCRDTDWKGEHGDELSWSEQVFFIKRSIRGLTPEDALLIVQAWEYYDNRGLGKLAGIDLFEAASRLVEQARSEAQSYSNEGSFLGAMLRVRIGEAIQDHVKKLLTRLDQRSIYNTNLTLMDAFSYIVALHADNILLLTKSVLARAVGCQLDLVHRQVIGPLGEEAAVTEHASYVLVRHRAIAEAAKSILKSSAFDIDFAEITIKLLRCAMESYFNRDLEIDVTYWNQLPNTVFNRGEIRLGIRLARVLIELEPNNPYHVVGLSKLYRRNRQHEEAVNVFRDSFHNVDADRAYYHEWSTAEGFKGNHDHSVWLEGISLADGIGEKRFGKNRICLSLSGLSYSFGKLFDRTNNGLFIESCGAAAHLGLQSQPDDRTKNLLLVNKHKSSQAGIGEVENEEALKRVISGIRLAWELSGENEELITQSITPADELTFSELAKRFGV